MQRENGRQIIELNHEALRAQSNEASLKFPEREQRSVIQSVINMIRGCFRETMTGLLSRRFFSRNLFLRCRLAIFISSMPLATLYLLFICRCEC